jgi:PKD repeat protein
MFTTNAAVTNIPAVETYNWDFGDGSFPSALQDPEHAYASAGNFTVVLTITDTSGCINSKSYLITIKDQPSALFSFTSGCLNTPVQFTDESFTPGSEPIAGWLWDFGVPAITTDISSLQNPTWTYTTTGVYNVSLIITSAGGCQDTTQLTITVNGLPEAGFAYTAAPCDAGAVYFQDSSFSQSSAIVEWQWMFAPDRFSTLKDPVYVFPSADSCYDVKLIVTNVDGCRDTVSKQVCVPAAFNFTFASSATCFRDSTFFTPQLILPLTDSLVFFNWNFGDPASGIYNTSAKKLPSHYYSQPGTYKASLQSTDINTCSETVYLDVIVKPLPVPLFSYTEGSCDSTVIFKDNSSGNGSGINQWIWSFGDGQLVTVVAPVIPDVSHQYPAAGIFTTSLTITNAKGCTNSTADSNVFVKPCINALFSVTDTLICQNNLISLADSSSNSLPATEWYWDFGDGSDTTYFTYTNPLLHVFETAGSFTVSMKVTTEIAGQKVSGTKQVIVVVNASPLPDFTFKSVCFKQDAVFTNITSGNGTLINGYKWDFGETNAPLNDTSSVRDPVHFYNNPGTYDVVLSAVNTIGCSDSASKPITVYGLPDANYGHSLSCAGDMTTFTDLSVRAVAPLVDWKWSFTADTELVGLSDVQNPDFVFSVPGNYLVHLMITDSLGCTDTISRADTTWSIPTSIYSFTDNFNDIQGQLQFTSTSIDAVRSYWTFGNGDDSYGTNPVAYYQNDGTYTITLVTWNGKDCSDTLTDQYTFLVKGLYVPNAFSPTNPQAAVRLLKPVGINLQEFLFEVYDRWGNLLWFTDKLDAAGKPTEGWDGTYNGILMQQGAYVWKASAVFRDGTFWDANNIGNNDIMPKLKMGTATMIR